MNRIVRMGGLWAMSVLVVSGCMDTQRGRIDGGLGDVPDTSVEADTAAMETLEPETVSDASSVDTQTPDTVEVGFFGGGWLIEQPTHALYEASFYRFEADGRVELVVSSPADCTGHLERFCETGHVSPPGGTLLCRLGGGSWEEIADRVLAIDSVCEDGVSRRVVLDFEGLDPTTWGTPTIVEVDGEEGWRHASWDWTFRRCNADLQFGFEPVRCE